ncbi:hypothetical protein ES707_09513 [subsurface metagenome]
MQDDSPNSPPRLQFESLFFNRMIQIGRQGEIRLRSSENDERAVRIRLGQPRETRPEDIERASLGKAESGKPFSMKMETLEIEGQGAKQGFDFPLSVDELSQYSLPRMRTSAPPGPAYVPARSTDIQDMARQWDAVALRAEGDRVIDCLRIVEPIERISAVEHPTLSGQRMFMVRLTNSSEPVPLRSLGDGTIHMLQIALALETARNGNEKDAAQRTLFDDAEASALLRMLLIDEVENGIYHGILPKLWKFIIEGARRFGVQVFATTHSFDCVRAFGAAAAADPESEGVVMRLEKHGDKNKVILYDKEEISTAVEQGIEVR